MGPRYRGFPLIALSFCLCLASAQILSGSEPIASVPLQARRGTSGTLFEEAPSGKTGIDFVNRLDPKSPLSFLYHSGMSCGGVAIGDVDGDGR